LSGHHFHNNLLLISLVTVFEGRGLTLMIRVLHILFHPFVGEYGVLDLVFHVILKFGGYNSMKLNL
jgi:hypothetical protein